MLGNDLAQLDIPVLLCYITVDKQSIEKHLDCIIILEFAQNWGKYPENFMTAPKFIGRKTVDCM